MASINETLETSTSPLAAALLFGYCEESLCPPLDLTVSQWADRFRVLSKRGSAEGGGPWRTARTPYLREIMDALGPDDPCASVVLMKGSQIGATEAGTNWLGYIIHQQPGPLLIMWPTGDLARRMILQRLNPLIRDTPEISRLVAQRRHEDSGGLMVKTFPGGMLTITGANSGAGLRSFSAKYLFLDEVDAYPESLDEEGDPVDLAMARTRAFGRHKVYMCSTPKNSGTSRIEAAFLESDQRRYYVPCPHCHEPFAFEFELLKWPEGHPAQVRMHCPACNGAIKDVQKHDMLRDGEWRATAKSDGTVRGYHLSSLYSPVGWYSWPQIARDYEKARRDADRMQVFRNTVLGLPFQQQLVAPDERRLYERRETYPIGKVPEGALVLTAGVDVQKSYLEIEIVGWDAEKRSWSIDFRLLQGDTTQQPVWDELSMLLDEEIPTAYGLPMKIAKMAVDTGFNTEAVYQWGRKQNPMRVILVKGDAHQQAILGRMSLVELAGMGNRVKHGLRLFHINTALAKEELYRWLELVVPDLEGSEPYPAGFCHFPQYGLAYFEQLCSEQLVMRVKRGVRSLVWQQIRDRNEALDARVYARAALASLRTELWSDKHWHDLKQAFIPRPVDVPAPDFESFEEKPRRASSIAQFRPVEARTDFLD